MCRYLRSESSGDPLDGEGVMVAYACKTIGCDGRVEFGDGSTTTDATAPTPKGPSRRSAIVFLEEEPRQCPKCCTAYYQQELE